MKKYDSYKASGVEWIGEIPSGWRKSKVKYHFQLLSGFPFNSEDITNEEREFPLIRIGNVTSGQTDVYFDGEILDKHPRVERGDYIISLTGDFSVRRWDNKCSLLNQRCGLIKQISSDDERYLFYFLPFQFRILEKTKYFTTLKNLSNGEFLDIEFLVPPLSEQQQIVSFLDSKTSQIEDLIAKKERLIQLLEEERTAMINQAVTKGLDPTVPMKDTGIEWLREIPEHWEEARVKNIVKIIGRIGFRGYTTADLVQKGQGAISLSPSNIKNHILNIDECTYLSWEKYHESPEIKIFENDIILVKTGSTIGKTAIIPNGTPEMTLNPQLVVFKDIKLNPVFLYYIMISNYFQGYFSVYTAGGSTPAISQEKINNFKITFPNELEQLKISSFISQKELEIKRIIFTTQQEIELLKEYKTALISEVVTGKVDVRDWVGIQNNEA